MKGVEAHCYSGKELRKAQLFLSCCYSRKELRNQRALRNLEIKGGKGFAEVPDFRDSFSPGLSHQKTRQKSELQTFILHGKTNNMAIPEYPNFGLYVKMVLSYG